MASGHAAPEPGLTCFSHGWSGGSGGHGGGVITLRGQLAADRTDVEVKANDVEIGRAVMVSKQTTLLGRLAQIIAHVRNHWSAQGLDRAVPDMPGPARRAVDARGEGADVGQTSHFDTLACLGAAGVTASYRIYAITADGNERASNTVTILRPE